MGSELGRVALLAVVMIAALAGCKRPPDARAQGMLRLTGTVLEQVDGPPYSYLRIKTQSGEVWAMVPITAVGRNERVTVGEGILLKDFDTGLPGRRFDVVQGTLAPR